MYRIVFEKQAVKDIRNLKSAKLDGKLLFIIATTDVVAALDAASAEGTLAFLTR